MTVRAGFIGGGFMGAVPTRAVRAARGELVALAISTPEKGRAAALELGVGRAEADAAALAAASDLDVVHVCSPNA
ncbi:MAG: Gfo/Idh/MocA family oxidoreductase, partial [Microbacterium sp.]|nr:Gfo/Idh/MocA family oxidoreductase [Microbacterium sp.]